MTNTVGSAVIEVAVDSRRVETGMSAMDNSIVRTGRSLATLGQQGAAALDGIGAAAGTNAGRSNAAMRGMINQLERATAAFESGKKSGADYYEVLARNRGLDLGQLRPYLDNLRAVEAEQRRSAEAVNVTRQAQEAAAEAARAETLAQREAAQALSGREAFLGGLREQITLYGRSAEEALRYRAAQAGVGAEAAPLILQLQNMRAAHEQVAVAARAEAQAQREALQVQNSQNAFVASLEQQANAIGRTRSELLELQAAQLGVTTQAAPFIARIRDSETAVARTGVSAAQTAAALRMVPAQLTDIVTSLQGGQAPLTVFLQQGGQLRDMFGSAGGAARALGGYVVSLITPFTLAAAGAAALAFAYHQGSKEAEAYNRALILSGNAAGTTAGQLGDMARNISNVSGTQSTAAEALAALAGTGRVGAENLQQFALVAVRAQKAVGQSVEETVKQFDELGKSPLQASERLTEQYHYLTGAVYAQIKALQDQGRLDEAGEVAQKAFAAAFGDRTAKIEQNLGLVQRAWNGVAGVAKGAWDAMLNVGREDSLEQKLAKVQEQIKKASGPFDASFGGNAEARSKLKANTELEASLQNQIKLANEKAASDAATAARNDAQLAWAKEGEKYLSRELQLKKEIAAATVLARKSAAVGEDPAVTEKRISDRVADIRRGYADIFNDGIDSQIEGIKRRGAVEESVAGRSLDLVKAYYAAGLIGEREYAQSVSDLSGATFEREKARLQEQLRLTAGKQNSQKDQAALRGELAKLEVDEARRLLQVKNDLLVVDVKEGRQAANNRADAIDRLATTRDGLKEQLRAQLDANAQIGLSKAGIDELAAAKLDDAAADRERVIAGIAVTDETKAQLALYQEQVDLLRQLAAAKRDGSVREVAVKAADDARQAWERTAEGINNSITDALLRGFENGKSAAVNFRDTVVNMFKTMVLKPTIQGLVTSAVGGGSPAAGGASALQTASGLGSLYNTFAGLGGTVSTLGNLFGSSAVSAFGAGLSGGAGVAEAVAAYQAAGMTTVASSLSAGASISTGITSALAAIPGWGWAAIGAAAIVGMSGLFDDGPEEHTRLTFNSNNAAGNISINERGNEGKTSQAYIDGSSKGAFGTFGLSSTFWSDGFSETVQSFIQTVTKVDDSLAGFLTETERAAVTAAITNKPITANLGAQGTNQNANGELDKVFADRLNIILEGVAPGLSKLESGFKGTSQELATEVAALLQYRAALKDSGEAVFGVKVTLEEVAALKKASESTATGLSRITNEFLVTSQAAAAIGKDSSKAFGEAGLASLGAREQLLLFAGGADALAQKAGSFSQNYLSQAEQLEPVSAALAEAMAKLGLAGVSTKDQFKAVAQGLDLTTEAGARQLAGMLDIEDAYSKVAEAQEQLNSAKRAAEIRLMEAQGDTLGALAAKRQDELAALAKTSPVLVELQKAANAAQDAVASANTKRAIEIAMLDAAGDAAGSLALRRADELAALRKTTPELVGMKQALYDLEDATAASSKRREQEIALMEASGDASGAAAARREDELVALARLGPAFVLAQQAINGAADALAVSTKARSLEIAIMQASGDAAGAVAAQRKDELAALAKVSPVLEAMQQAAYDAADALDVATKRRALEIAIMQASGNAAGAVAAQRKDELAALAKLSPVLAAMQQTAYDAADALDVATKRRALEIAVMQASGNAASAVAAQREDEIKALAKVSPLLAALQQAAYDAADSTEYLSKKRALEIELMQAQGNMVGATAAQRSDEVAALAKVSYALAQQKAAAYAAADALQLATDRRQLEIQLMEAQGDVAAANAARREDELAALEKATPALVQLTKALHAAQDAAALASARMALEIEIMQATGNASGALAAQRASELEAMKNATPALVSMKLALYAIQDAAHRTDAAMAVLRKSVDAEKTTLHAGLDAQLAIITAQKSAAQASFEAQKTVAQQMVDAISKENSKLRSLDGALKSTLDSMRLPDNAMADRAVAQNLIAQALSAAKAGGALPDADALASALKIAASQDTSQFSSYEDFVRDYGVTAGKIADLADLTGVQLTASDQQLELAKQQLDALDKAASATSALYDESAKAAQAAYDQQAAQLDAQLVAAQEQLDAANNTTVAVKSVEAALREFNASLQALARAQTAGQSAANSSIPVAPSVSAAAAVESALNAYKALIRQSSTYSVASEKAGVYNELFASYAKSYAESYGGMAVQLQQLGTAVTTALAPITAATQLTAESSGKFAEQFDNVSAGGNILQMEVA